MYSCFVVETSCRYRRFQTVLILVAVAVTIAVAAAVVAADGSASTFISIASIITIKYVLLSTITKCYPITITTEVLRQY